jgi:hypothetical protein
MSEQAKEGLYIYQPFGQQDGQKWKEGRIYGIGGLPIHARVDGLTKQEAESILSALKGLWTQSEAIRRLADHFDIYALTPADQVAQKVIDKYEGLEVRYTLATSRMRELEEEREKNVKTIKQG